MEFNRKIRVISILCGSHIFDAIGLDRANSPRKSDLNGFIKFFQSCTFDPIAWMLVHNALFL